MSLAALRHMHGRSQVGRRWLSRVPAHHPRPAGDRAGPPVRRAHYAELSSLLRRNEHMLLVEQRHIDQQLADLASCKASYWDLVLYEFFGCQSQRGQQQASAFRQRRRHLSRLQLLLVRARCALDDGNLGLAERILWRVSPQLGIVPDPVGTSVDELPVLGDPDLVVPEGSCEAG